MTDLTITAASVIAGTAAAGTAFTSGTAGTTITAGQPVYDSGSGVYLLADNDGATAAARVPAGIALHAALTGQPLKIQTQGPITIGAALTAGLDYYLSNTAGLICPRADLATGERVVLLGLATSTTVLKLGITDTAVVL